MTKILFTLLVSMVLVSDLAKSVLQCNILSGWPWRGVQVEEVWDKNWNFTGIHMMVEGEYFVKMNWVLEFKSE